VQVKKINNCISTAKKIENYIGAVTNRKFMSVRVKKLKILIGAANKIKKLYFASPLVSSPRSFGVMRTFLRTKHWARGGRAL